MLLQPIKCCLDRTALLEEAPTNNAPQTLDSRKSSITVVSFVANNSSQYGNRAPAAHRPQGGDKGIPCDRVRLHSQPCQNLDHDRLVFTNRAENHRAIRPSIGLRVTK